MSAHTIYRIRNKATGEFYSGGASGGWGERGMSYERASACKCAWQHFKRYRKGYLGQDLPEAEIVKFTVTEVAGEAEPL